MNKAGEELCFKVAMDADLIGIRELLTRNLADNLTPQQKKDGFLSIDFSIEQLREMVEDGITIVALSDSNVVGFLSTQTCNYNLEVPIAKTMIQFLGDTIDQDKTLVCGPVCLDQDYRGQGLFEKMYQLLSEEVVGRFNTGITFVSNSNPRSIAAHQRKIGMKLVDEFDEENKSFTILRYEFG